MGGVTENETFEDVPSDCRWGYVWPLNVQPEMVTDDIMSMNRDDPRGTRISLFHKQV
jgi:hypothetical protein